VASSAALSVPPTSFFSAASVTQAAGIFGSEYPFGASGAIAVVAASWAHPPAPASTSINVSVFFILVFP
jgi:hypothetical protein